MPQTTDSRPPTTTYSYTPTRSPALAENGIFSTTPSDLRTGIQFPVSSIQYQVSHTDNARFTYSWNAENRLSSVSSLSPQSSPSSAVKIESTYNAENRLISVSTTQPVNGSTKLEFSPFGEITASTGTMKDNFDFRFSSEFLDQETGLVYYNYRYYSPQLGRWTARDPIGEEGGWNLYVMVRNNPLARWDYLGLQKEKESKATCVDSEDIDGVIGTSSDGCSSVGDGCCVNKKPGRCVAYAENKIKTRALCKCVPTKE